MHTAAAPFRFGYCLSLSGPLAGNSLSARLAHGFFVLAAEQRPRAATVALVPANAEFSRNPILGAKANAEKYGIRRPPIR